MLRWIARTLIAVLGLVFVAAVAGFAYQSLATRIDRARTPAPGRFLDVGWRNCARSA
jgi:hypothetical protein